MNSRPRPRQPANGYQEFKRDAGKVFDLVFGLALVYGFVVLVGASALVAAALGGVALGLVVLVLGAGLFFLWWKAVTK